jgi:hypothetical protein
VRAAIGSLDPALPVGSALPLDEVVGQSLRSRRFVLVLVAVFGGSALALAGIGLFGVMAYLVAQRTSELGVRLVLGARPSDVLRLVVGDGMRLVGLGLALGLAGAPASARSRASSSACGRGTRGRSPESPFRSRSWPSLRSRHPPGARRASTPRGRCASNSLDERTAAAATVYSGQVREHACPRRSSSVPTTPAST